MKMTDYGRVSLVALVLMLGFPAAAFAADAGDTAAQTKPAKLPTDGEVRHGMVEIRHLLDQALPAIKAGSLDQAGYSRLADGIFAQVEQLAANSRLPDSIKASLKAELAPLVAATQALQTKGEIAAAAIFSALDHYGRVFDHPGWSMSEESKQGR
jgi:hypothetical protein